MEAAMVLEPGDYIGTVRRRTICDVSTVSETSYVHGMAIPMHQHSRPYFMFVVRGRYTELSRLGRRSISEGQAFYHPPDFVHSGTMLGANARILNVEFSSNWLATNDGSLKALEKHVSASPPQLSPILARIYQELRRPDAYTPSAVHGLSLELFVTAERARGSCSPPPWLARAREFLREATTPSITLHDLAAEVSVHPATLSRVFRSHFGCSVANYVRRLRVEKACRLILSTNRPFSEVALAAGFYDQSHLTRCVRSHSGLAPGALRRSGQVGK